MTAVRVEAVEAQVDAGDVVGGELGGRRQLRTRVGLVDEVELDAGHGERRVTAQVGDDRVGRRVAGALRVGLA